jgi:hypothetical protein
VCGTSCVNLSDNSLNCGGCGTACAANLVCGGGACISPTTGNGGLGGTLTGSSPPKVGVMAATSSGTDLQGKLSALGQFSSVTYTNMSPLPTVAAMQAFDAIVAYTFISPPTGFGDNLKTYLESGGGVVICDYSSAEAGFSIGGAYQTTYLLMTPSTFLTTAVNFGTGTPGTILDPTSPLMAGLVNVGIKTSGQHMSVSNVPKAGTTIVAQWSDGAPAVMWNTINGHKVAELNMYGTSTTSSSSGWDATTDGAKLIANALNFVLPPSVLVVTKSVDAGSQPLYTQSAPQVVTYTNNSATAQTITALSISGTHIGDFAVSPSSGLPATIPPGGTFTVNVTFAPSGVGLRAALLNATVMGFAGPATTKLLGTGI